MQNSFGKNIIPDNDAARLKALHRYNFYKHLPEGYFNKLAHIVAESFNAPIALISLVDKDEVRFAGNIGMTENEKAPRGISLCSLAILDTEPTIFKDALKEPCLLANPLVVGNFGMRFYAGAPIITDDGFAIGTVCIVSKEPRDFTKTEEEMLKSFAKTAMTEIELRQQMLESASS